MAHSPSRLVHYLRSHVPARSLIETPEYELVFLDDDHRIHLMPPYYFVESTPDRVVLLNPRIKPYDFNRVGADLLVLGPFGKSVFKQIYQPSRISRGWHRIATVEGYDIYLRRDRDQKPAPHTSSSRPGMKLAVPSRDSLATVRPVKMASP
jgi:hypothetical protein